MRSLTFQENIALGKEYLLNFQEVYNFPFLSREEISRYQFDKTKKLISLAYNHTKFYRELYSKQDIHPEDIKSWKDFYKLPTVTKSDLNAHYANSIVDTKLNDKNLILSRSSGSSGELINILFESGSWYKQAMITLRMYQQAFDYKPFDKQALIYPSKFPYDSILGFYKASYIYSLSEPHEILKRLHQLQPALIVCYPSILLELITYANYDLKELRPKAISTNSEHSTQEQRDFISKVFNCPVMDEYSTEELTLVGYQCKYKQYHIQEDGAYIEILDVNSDKALAEGEVGEVVGTCLVNNVMPFIRYRVGDLAAMQTSECSCNNNCRVLSDIAGRRNASFTFPDGTVVSSGRILDWTYKLFLEYKIPISQFQIVQHAKDSIEAVIVPKDSYNRVIHNDIIDKSFRREFGEMVNVTITTRRTIPKTAAGKHIPIKSFVKPEEKKETSVPVGV